MATVSSPMTAEEFLALPDDGVERWLVAGELRERGKTTRNRFHSRIMTRVAQLLANWADGQPEPRGQVLTGDAAVRLRHDPDTVYGIDVVSISADVVARQTDESTIIDGIPTLAVEILSPSDTVEDINDRIDDFLQAGVPLVWIIDPRRRTVTVHRPDGTSELFDHRHDLTGGPQLPGLRVPVARLFT